MGKIYWLVFERESGQTSLREDYPDYWKYDPNYEIKRVVIFEIEED